MKYNTIQYNIIQILLQYYYYYNIITCIVTNHAGRYPGHGYTWILNPQPAT